MQKTQLLIHLLLGRILSEVYYFVPSKTIDRLLRNYSPLNEHEYE